MKYVLLGIGIGIVVGVGGFYVVQQTLVDGNGTTIQREDALSPSGVDVFRFTLEEEVIKKQGGQPPAGFTPELFFTAFAGLTQSDFDGVAGSGGVYLLEAGTLTFVIDEQGLVPSTPGAVSDYARLLQNIAERNKIDLVGDGTLTDVIRAIVTP